jgi:hypothetical protein
MACKKTYCRPNLQLGWHVNSFTEGTACCGSPDFALPLPDDPQQVPADAEAFGLSAFR